MLRCAVVIVVLLASGLATIPVYAQQSATKSTPIGTVPMKTFPTTTATSSGNPTTDPTMSFMQLFRELLKKNGALFIFFSISVTFFFCFLYFCGVCFCSKFMKTRSLSMSRSRSTSKSKTLRKSSIRSNSSVESTESVVTKKPKSRIKRKRLVKTITKSKSKSKSKQRHHHSHPHHKSRSKQSSLDTLSEDICKKSGHR